jgi:hypothetical protein
MKGVVILLWLLPNFGYLAYSQQAGSAIGSGGMFKGAVVTGENVKLPYATVKLAGDSNTYATAVCDSNGHFELNWQRAHANDMYIQAFYLKLTSRPYRVSNNDPFVTLVIEDTNNVLAEIVVKQSAIQRKADRFVFVPGKDLSKGSSTLEMLKHVPLINYNDRTEDISIISKPGTVVYINNRKTEMPKEMLLQVLRALPATDIRNIELITNPGSEYNANTTGGIININLKRQSYEGWLGNLALQTVQSKYNTTILNGGINFRKGKLALQFLPFFNRSYNYHTAYNVLDNTNGFTEQLNRERFRRYTVYGGGVNADYDINSKNFISIKTWNSSVYGKSNTDVLTSYSFGTSAATDSAVDSHIQGKDQYSYNFGNVNYHYNTGGKKQAWLDANFDYNHFFQRRKNNGNFQPLKSTAPENAVFYKNELPQRFNNLSGRVEFGEMLRDGLNFSTGLQYSNTSVRNDLQYYNQAGADYYLDTELSKRYDYSEKYWAAFVNFKREISKSWNVALGLRMEGVDYITEVKKMGVRADSSYNNLYPSLAVSFSPKPRHQFGYSLSRKISRPNIELLFPGRTYNNPAYFTENNPFLQPSLTWNNELSYLLNSRFSFALSYMVAEQRYANFVVPVEESNAVKMKETYLNYGREKGLSFVFNGNQPLFKGFWEIYLTTWFTFNRYTGTVAGKDINVENRNFNFLYDNYIYLSKKKGWMGFVTFRYNGPVKDMSGAVINATTSLDLELKKTFKKFTFYLIAGDVYNGSSFVKTNQFANSMLQRNYAETNTYNRSVLFKVRYSFGNGQLKSNKERNTANEDIKNRSNK